MIANNEYLLIALIALGLGLTLIGVKSGKGVYNLLSIPVWVLLGIEFITVYPVLAITFIGLVIFEFYFAFWGNQ